ncbi:hypothetical protein E1B28_003427 [Marasmius oreades]|uniref:Uncharacterized protein n=1 Tax=Marasmius oreades TaxID=181124 RepID=A0A9P7UKK5_9AGAR|nr:uncharacterized protein E1B28_003427 [Marasmius oreades]KAG7085893.1 hypothetical protein E1B28_003427 [Marasmius oreades]
MVVSLSSHEGNGGGSVDPASAANLILHNNLWLVMISNLQLITLSFSSHGGRSVLTDDFHLVCLDQKTFGDFLFHCLPRRRQQSHFKLGCLHLSERKSHRNPQDIWNLTYHYFVKMYIPRQLHDLVHHGPRGGKKSEKGSFCF